MVARGLFTPAHITAIAARAAELEREGEDTQDPLALVRAARLYTLAVRIADEIDGRAAAAFTRVDLTRARDELRVLAADAAASGARGDDYLLPADGQGQTRGTITRAFREIALRIEERLPGEDTLPRHRPDPEPRV
jgi:hypothetical protein